MRVERERETPPAASTRTPAPTKTLGTKGSSKPVCICPPSHMKTGHFSNPAAALPKKPGTINSMIRHGERAHCTRSRLSSPVARDTSRKYTIVGINWIPASAVPMATPIKAFLKPPHPARFDSQCSSQEHGHERPLGVAGKMERCNSSRGRNDPKAPPVTRHSQPNEGPSGQWQPRPGTG